MTFFTVAPIWCVYRLFFFKKRAGIPDEEDFDGFPPAKQLLDSGWLKSRPDPASHPETSHERVEDNKPRDEPNNK